MEAHFHLARYLMLSGTSAGKPVYKADPEIRTGGYVRISFIEEPRLPLWERGQRCRRDGGSTTAKVDQEAVKCDETVESGPT